MTTKFLSTSLGRLRLVAILEGLSLILLVFVAVPIKYLLQEPLFVKIIGPIHGALFLIFVINALTVAVEQRWKFSTTTWKVLIACLIPFGTFYIDRTILRKLS